MSGTQCTYVDTYLSMQTFKFNYSLTELHLMPSHNISIDLSIYTFEWIKMLFRSG